MAYFELQDEVKQFIIDKGKPVRELSDQMAV